MVALQISSKIENCMNWVDKPQNYKGLYGILELLQGFHLNNFLLKTWLGNFSFGNAAE